MFSGRTIRDWVLLLWLVGIFCGSVAFAAPVDESVLHDLGGLLSDHWPLILLGLLLLACAALLQHTRRLKPQSAVRTRPLCEAKRHTELKAQADYLTNLPNRRHFLERLARDLAQSKRHNVPLSLIMVDIDYFRKVNSRYGHAAGDEVLRRVGEQIQSHIREGDVVARMEADEFAVACLNTEQQEVMSLSQRLCRAVEMQIIQYGDDAISITVSIGIAVLEMGDDATGLLKKAEMALHEAKGRGCNTVCAHTSPSMDSTS